MKRIYVTLTMLLLFSTILFAQKDYEGFVKDALVYTEKKDFAAAEQSYKAAMRQEPANPSNIMLMMNLGTVQRYLGKFEESLISYNVVAQKHPTLSHILENRAGLYCDMGRYEDALKDYSTILLHHPNHLETLYNRGLLHIALRNLDEAEGDFKNIIASESDNVRAKAGVAMVMKRRGHWKEAEELYTELISENKRSGELYANRAECYLNLKKLRSLSDDLDKAIEYGYNDFSVYILRGQQLLEQYDKMAAKKAFTKAQEMGAGDELLEDFFLLCK